RDPKIAVSLVEAYVVDQMAGLAPLAGDSDPAFGAELEKMRTFVDKLSTKLDEGVIDADKGLLLLERGDAIIYGSADPQALPKLLKELGADEIPKHCAAIEGAKGYAACTNDEAVLAEVVPGKQAAALRKAI